MLRKTRRKKGGEKFSRLNSKGLVGLQIYSGGRLLGSLSNTSVLFYGCVDEHECSIEIQNLAFSQLQTFLRALKNLEPK
jgi:hypothetical protein